MANNTQPKRKEVKMICYLYLSSMPTCLSYKRLAPFLSEGHYHSEMRYLNMCVYVCVCVYVCICPVYAWEKRPRFSQSMWLRCLILSLDLGEAYNPKLTNQSTTSPWPLGLVQAQAYNQSTQSKPDQTKTYTFLKRGMRNQGS